MRCPRPAYLAQIDKMLVTIDVELSHDGTELLVDGRPLQPIRAGNGERAYAVGLADSDAAGRAPGIRCA